MKFYYIFFIPFIVYILNFHLKKFNFLKNFSGESHQKYVGEKKIPLSGGLFLIFFLFFNFYSNNIEFYIYLLLIFLIGFSADIRYLTSPLKRMCLQIILILSFSYNFDLQINLTGIIFLDQILSNYYTSILFTSFCLIILINGSNFIDGLNGLALGYFTLILIFILKLNLINPQVLNESDLYYIAYLAIILLIFNLLNNLYLGDSGVYLLSFLIGFILISTYNKFLFSPFFIVLLLWYPCYENLFSIIRKFRLHKSPVKPDNKHLHQLIFLFFRKKTKFNKILINSCSSLIINLYNFIIFYFGSLNIFHSQYLIVLIFLNIIIYTVCYLKLFQSQANSY